MKQRKTILSTKILTLDQKELLASFELIDNDFILIKSLPFDVNNISEIAVFTSQNAVKKILEYDFFKNEIKDVCCVGDKTTTLLNRLGKNVLYTGSSSKELAIEVVRQGHKEVDFFCGTIRKKDLPNILAENEIKVNEILVYETKKVGRKIEQAFDGILFFSPSGVQSYLLKNKARDSVAFCIGETTKSEALKDFKTVCVAETTTIESVIDSTLKYFN